METEVAKGLRVEDIATVEEQIAAHEGPHFLEVEREELRPLGGKHDRVRTPYRFVRVCQNVQKRNARNHADDRIMSRNDRSHVQQRPRYIDRRSVSQVVRTGLKGQPEEGDAAA